MLGKTYGFQLPTFSFWGYTPPKMNIEPEKNLSRPLGKVRREKKTSEAKTSMTWGGLVGSGCWLPFGFAGLPNGLRPLRPRGARQRQSRPRRPGRRGRAAGAARAAAAAGAAGELGKAGGNPQVMEVCDSGYQQTNMTIMGKISIFDRSYIFELEILGGGFTQYFVLTTILGVSFIQIDTSRYLEVGIHPGTSWEGVSHHKLHKLR